MRLFRSFKFFEFKFKSLFLVLFFVIASFGSGNVFGMMEEWLEPTGAVRESLIKQLQEEKEKVVGEMNRIKSIDNQFRLNKRYVFLDEKSKELESQLLDLREGSSQAMPLATWPIPEEIREAFSPFCEEFAMNLQEFLVNNSTANYLYNAEFIYENIFKKVWIDICNIFDFKTVDTKVAFVNNMRSLFMQNTVLLSDFEKIFENLQKKRVEFEKEPTTNRIFIETIDRVYKVIPEIKNEVLKKVDDTYHISEDKKMDNTPYKQLLSQNVDQLSMIFIKMRLLKPQTLEPQFIEPYVRQKFNPRLHRTTALGPQPGAQCYLLSPNLAYYSFDHGQITNTNPSYYRAWVILAEGKEPIDPTSSIARTSQTPQQTITTTTAQPRPQSPVRPVSPTQQPSSFSLVPQAQPQTLTPERSQKWLDDQYGYLHALSNQINGFSNTGANLKDLEIIVNKQLQPMLDYIKNVLDQNQDNIQLQNLNNMVLALGNFANLIFAINNNNFNLAQQALGILTQDNYKLFKALRDDLQERVRLISGYVQQQLQQQPQPPMPPQLVPQVRPVAPVQPPITPSPRQAPSPRAIIPDRWQNLPSIKKLRGDESFTSQNAGERTEEYFKPIFEFILSLYIIPNFNYGSFSNEIKNEINFIEENLRQIRGYMFHDEVHDLKNFALESINYIKNKQNYTPVFGMDRLQRAINSESDLYIRDSLKKLVNNIYEQINKSQQARSPMPPQPVPQPVVPVQPPTRPSVQPPRILRPSEEFARQDKIRKELEEKINEAETILKDNYESIDAKQLTEIIKLKTRLEQFYKTYSDNVISKFTGSGGIDVAIITLKDRALAVKKQIEDKLSELEIRKMTLEEQGLQPQQQARPVRLWRPTTPSPEELRRRAEEARREESAKKTIDETQEMVKVVSSNLENVSKDLEVLNVSDSNLSEKLGRINKYLSDVREWIEQHKDVLSRNVDLSDSQKTALMQWLDNLLLKIKVMQEKADELFARKLQLELALGQQQQYQPPQLRAQLFSFNSYGHRHRHR